MTDVIFALSDILARENAALECDEFAHAIALGPAKSRAIAALLDQRGQIDQVDPAALGRLHELAHRNAELLSRAADLQGRLVATLAAALVRAQAEGPALYGSAARQALPLLLARNA